MTIAKDRVHRSLRKIRGLYKDHEIGKLIPSEFVARARKELNTLYLEHTLELIQRTVDHVTVELRSFQTQFGLDLVCSEHRLSQVTRGYRGIRASMYVDSKEPKYYHRSFEILIGPFDQWNKIAVRTFEEEERDLSFYTRKKRRVWKAMEDFDFPGFLQQIKEDFEKPEPEYEEDEFPF